MGYSGVSDYGLSGLSWVLKAVFTAVFVLVFTISKPLVQNEELEREKLEQLVLLQDLEEQKAELEQMLLESRPENNQLKVVAAHEEPQPGSIIPDHGGGSAGATQVCSVLILLFYLSDI